LLEVLGESLLITGGWDRDYDALEEVVRIESRREFAVAHCAPMLTPRMAHAAVYHTPHLYILGGLYGINYLCERYVCAENRREPLTPLPKFCQGASGVGVENSLYALGGYGSDMVQK
jgi:hypothetical protein